MLSFFKKHYFYFFYFSVVRIRLSQELNLKTKTKHTNKNRNTDRDHTEGYQWAVGAESMEEKAQGIRSINSRYKIDRGVKNSMGNGKAKEHICMTHGHKLRWGNDGGRVQGRED